MPDHSEAGEDHVGLGADSDQAPDAAEVVRLAGAQGVRASQARRRAALDAISQW